MTDTTKLLTLYRMLNRHHQRMLIRKAIALVYYQRWASR